ncbi:unnamed protein product [Dicrocoelium dendriticum]|nr:unnamed protein product [Dicrocoelium dendriticum]
MLYYWQEYSQSVASFEKDSVFPYGLSEDSPESAYFLSEHGDPPYLPLLLEEFSICCGSVLAQVLGKLLLTLCLCLSCRILRLLSQTYFKSQGGQRHGLPLLDQVVSIASGVALLWCFFGVLGAIPLGFSLCVGLIFVWKSSNSSASTNLSLSSTVVHAFVLCLSTLVYGECYMDPVQWHQIRGSVMIIIMRAISFALDLHHTAHVTDVPSDELYPDNFGYRQYLLWLSYTLCPASLVFGPWFDVHQYHQLIRHPPKPNVAEPLSTWYTLSAFWHSIVHAAKSLSCALFCLLWSTCVSHILLPDWSEHM